MQPDDDPRTVLQAHSLRTQMATAALINGSASPRGKTIGVRVVIFSLVIAAVVLGGIIIAGFVIDLLSRR
ncbi:MAG: hypothetical protein WBF79_00945 [Rhodococcus sp. (in: high G+C Gram-positive bacteria)]